jgi:hypothetical protein
MRIFLSASKASFRKVTDADSFEKLKLLVAVATFELGPQVYSETITDIYASMTRVLLHHVKEMV